MNPFRGNVFSYEARGHFTLPMVRWIFDRYEVFASDRRPPYLVFANLHGLKSYESAVRVEATEWFKPRLVDIECFHVAVSSKLVSMGIATMALLSGLEVQSYSNVAAFEASRERALRGRTGAGAEPSVAPRQR